MCRGVNRAGLTSARYTTSRSKARWSFERRKPLPTFGLLTSPSPTSVRGWNGLGSNRTGGESNRGARRRAPGRPAHAQSTTASLGTGDRPRTGTLKGEVRNARLFLPRVRCEGGGGLTVVEIPAAHQRGIFLELDQCQRPCCCRWQTTADKPLRRADPVAVRDLLDSTQRLGACALVANRFVSRLSRQQAREPSAVLATA
jgi:hypothetical protein